MVLVIILGAEILYRLPEVNPFMEAREVIDNCPKDIRTMYNYSKKSLFIRWGSIKGLGKSVAIR